MSATTSTKYEEAEKSWEGELINIYISGTYSIEIHIGKEDNETEKFRANLVPLLTFMKQKLKNVDWEEISRTRDKKWGYKRIESGELFDLLSRTDLT